MIILFFGVLDLLCVKKYVIGTKSSKEHRQMKKLEHLATLQ